MKYFETPEGKEILSRLKQNDPALTWFNLCWKELDAEGMKFLMKGLKINHTLVFLGLGANKFDTEGMKFLVEALKANHTLTFLDLGGNRFSAEAVNVLVEALQSNKSLFDIYLEPHLRTAEFKALLARNQTLKDQLHEAVQQDDIHRVRQLVQEGISLLSISGAEENTPLHWAVLKGHARIALYLMAEMAKRGNPLNVLNKAKKTAAELAQDNPKLKAFSLSFSLLRKANEHVAKQQWHEALTCYEQLLQQDENLIVAWLGKADVLLQQKEYTKAEACFDKVLLLDENNVENLLSKVTISIAQERLELALSYLEKIQALQPDLYKIYYMKAQVLLQRGQVTEALICYDEFLKIDAKHQGALQQKIWILCHQKQYSDALTQINLALQHYPNDEIFSNSSSYIVLQQKKIKGMMEVDLFFKRLINQSNSSSSFALQGKGFVELDRKRTDSAEHYFTQAEQAAKNNDELALLFFQRAEVYQAWNMPAAAKTCYEKTLQYEINHPFAKLYLSQLTASPISALDKNSNYNDASALPQLSKPLGKLAISFVIPYSQLTFGRQIKKGDFGMVYQGIWRNITVAIKQLVHDQFSEDTLIKFQNEMAVMAKLRHPHIVQLYGVVTDHSPYCIVMEYLSGGSLYDFLRRSIPISWEQREQIALDVAKGLSYLHEENILHRDLKSLNVLLDEYQKAKLCDFGLAKERHATAGTISDNNSVVGTVSWMAPELFQNEKCTKASDIYSYGMVLWEIATCDIPFKTLTLQVLQTEQPEIIPPECKMQSPKLAHLITLCWNKNSSKRPTAASVVTILQDKENVNSLESEDFIDNLASMNNNNVNSATTFDSIDNLRTTRLSKNG